MAKQPARDSGYARIKEGKHKGLWTVDLARLTDNETTKVRAIDRDVVEEYVEAMTAGAIFPPIDVIDDGEALHVVDGWHRLSAATERGETMIVATVQSGTTREAILQAVGANVAHGHRRTNADKRAAVTVLLNDKQWKKWADRRIAQQCGVSHTFVADTRKSLATAASEKRWYVTKHGTEAEMALPPRVEPTPSEDKKEVVLVPLEEMFTEEEIARGREELAARRLEDNDIVVKQLCEVADDANYAIWRTGQKVCEVIEQEAWRDCERGGYPQGHPQGRVRFESFEAFVQAKLKELDDPLADLRRICRDNAAAIAAIDRACNGHPPVQNENAQDEASSQAQQTPTQPNT